MFARDVREALSANPHIVQITQEYALSGILFPVAVCAVRVERVQVHIELNRRHEEIYSGRASRGSTHVLYGVVAYDVGPYCCCEQVLHLKLETRPAC
ncbi:hypothetical protein DC008_23870 [Streptomyces nigra]|nr:hypothetical protein DC008_23870 [Streptomyces nigra]